MVIPFDSWLQFLRAKELSLLEIGMQTERKSFPAGKTKDIWDDADESFFKVRGTERV